MGDEHRIDATDQANRWLDSKPNIKIVNWELRCLAAQDKTAPDEAIEEPEYDVLVIEYE